MDIMAEIQKLLDNPDAAPWLFKVLVALAILATTAIIASMLGRIVHRVLRRDDVDVPANSILVNIMRAMVWFAGIASVLGYCFDVDVNGLIAGLGIVGIAISLGFQGTLSDLISGIFISLNKVCSKGEFIRYGATEGKVLDVSWRHTLVEDYDHHIHVIPNSTIAEGEVVRLADPQFINVPVLFPYVESHEELDAYLRNLEKVVDEALKDVVELKAPTVAMVNGSTYAGLDGLIKVWIERGSISPKVVTAKVGEAAAPFCSKLA